MANMSAARLLPAARQSVRWSKQITPIVSISFTMIA
jgi:hypothetical protein